MAKNDKEILKTAHKRYSHATTIWSDFQQKSNELQRFISGDQWTESSRNMYENAGFAAMTSNRIPTFLRQITNEIRKNPPSIQIDPKDDGKVETAEVLSDLIRNIQLDSSADIAYTKAAENCASVGIGFIKVSSTYEDDKSFNQKIVIESIDDVNTVLIDPDHRGLCAEDAEWAFITVMLSKDEYKRKYRDTKLTKLLEDVQWMSGNGKRNWIQSDGLLIAEYYFKDYETKILCQVFDNMSGNTELKYKDELDPIMLEEGMLIIQNERKVQIPIVRVCKLNEVEVLEETVWPGCYLPIIAVKANEYWLEGKRKLVGAVEPAVESQVKLNYSISHQCQLLQMAPKAPYIGTAEQFQTFEQQWANINVSNQAFMPYNFVEGAPPPSRDLGEVPIQAAGALVMQAQEDLKQIFGTFDPSQQAAGPESGKAILARQGQSYNSNYHFYDNLAKSIQHCGRVIVDAIPVFYDTPRQIQGITQAGEKHSVMVNQMDEYGNIEHDLTKGTYGVSIETGPSFGTKRQEAVEQLTNLMEIDPQMAMNLADLAISNMDFPGADEAAARARAMVNPQVLEASSEGKKEVPAQVAQQLKSQVTALTQQLQAVKPQMDEMKLKLTDAEQTNKMLQHDQTVEATKAELEYKVKTRDADLKEAMATMEYQIKEQELKLQERELALKEAEVGIKATSVLADVSSEHLEQSRKHHAHVVEMEVGTPEPIGDPQSNNNSMSGDINRDME